MTCIVCKTSLTQLQTLGPIDRTPGIPGSDKKPRPAKTNQPTITDCPQSKIPFTEALQNVQAALELSVTEGVLKRWLKVEYEVFPLNVLNYRPAGQYSLHTANKSIVFLGNTSTKLGWDGDELNGASMSKTQKRYDL